MQHHPRVLILAASLNTLTSCGDGGAKNGLDLPAAMSVQASDGSGVFVWIADDNLLDSALEQTGQPAIIQWQLNGASWTDVEGPAGISAAANTRYFLPLDSVLADSVLADSVLADSVLADSVLADSSQADLSALSLRVQVDGQAGLGTAPLAISFYTDLGTLQAPLNSSDSLAPTLAVSLSPLEDRGGAVEVQVSIQSADGTQTGWLDNHCTSGAALRECLLDEPNIWAVSDLDNVPALPFLSAVHDLPGSISFTVRLYLDAVNTDGQPGRVLLTQDDTSPILSMGRKLYWGDLHAHSNLSMDGCEDPDADCGIRGDYAAQDFFANARDEGLDFVAITDHAEWGTFYSGGLGTTGVDIWAEQQRLAQAADGAGLVTIVGYEWTNYRNKPTDVVNGYEGGHKTVLFEDLAVDPEYRIGAERDEDVVKKADGSTYLAAANKRTNDPTTFYEWLDDAMATHGQIRALTFFHHSAIDSPQGVDFRQSFNWPDPRYEPVIEMYSEHGSSECYDVGADYCDFAVQEQQLRLDYGTVQYALSIGLQLGFVSGTDCHDGRPGSINDGPGWHGNPNGEDSVVEQQFAAGGITGAWVSGPLDRIGLMDSLFERATLSSTGPRVKVHLMSVDDQGRAYLPGATVAADATTLSVAGRIDGNGYTVQRIQLIDRTGAMVADQEGSVFSDTIDLEPGGAWYIRVILAGQELTDTGGTDTDTGTGTGDSGTGDSGTATNRAPHRVWMSPFFTDPAR